MPELSAAQKHYLNLQKRHRQIVRLSRLLILNILWKELNQNA